TAEQSALDYLSGKYQVSWMRNVGPSDMPNVSFDAVAIESDRCLVVEVRYLENRLMRQSVERNFQRVSAFYNSLTNNQKENFTLLYVLTHPHMDQGYVKHASEVVNSVAIRF